MDPKEILSNTAELAKGWAFKMQIGNQEVLWKTKKFPDTTVWYGW